MKRILGNLALYFLLSMSPAMAEKPPSFEELQKQLVAALQKDMAEMAGKPSTGTQAEQNVGRAIHMVRDMKSSDIQSDQLRQLDTYVRMRAFPEATDALLQQFYGQAKAEIEARKIKKTEEFTAKVRGYLTRALATKKPDEIAAIQKELVAYGEEIGQLDHRDVRSALPASGSVSNPRSVLDSLAKFHAAMAAEEWGSAGSSLSNLDQAVKNVEPFLSTKESTEHMAKLRADAGIVTPQGFETLYQKTLAALLDDANQERIEEIISDIRKHRSLSGSSSSSSSPATRWDRMSSFASALLQSVQRVRDGGVPQFSVESWTKPDSSYPVLMSKEKLVEALGKYRVKVRMDAGKTREERLYYTVDELRDAASSILLEMLDDANQDRLDEIHERIRMFQRFVSYSSEHSGMSQRFQQVASFAQYFIQAVRRVQDGGVPRMNLDEWLRSNSEYGRLMEKDVLSGLLKKYRVKVKNKEGKVSEFPLHQDVNDIFARIASAEDIEKELRALTLISQSSSYDSGQGNIAQAAAALTSLAEVHASLKKGMSFPLVHAQASSMYEWSNRALPQDPMADSPVSAQLEALRNEVERAVLARMVPGVKIDAAGNRDEVMGGLIKKFSEEKNFAAVLAVGRVALHFAPKRPLIPHHELQAIQSYIDGVRQQEELGEPRLATMHFQRAAAARSTIIPVEELRKRLSQLKLEQAQAYDKGTDDALSAERPGVPPLAQYVTMPPLVVPGR